MTLSARARAAGIPPYVAHMRRHRKWPEHLLCAPVGTRLPPPAPTDAALWGRLEAIRRASGLSASAVSQAIGKHRVWYSQQRKAQRALSAEVAAALESTLRAAVTARAKAALEAL